MEVFMSTINNNMIKLTINKILNDGKINIDNMEYFYYKSIQSKTKITKEVHEVALLYLLEQYKILLKEEDYKIKKIRKAIYAIDFILIEYLETNKTKILLELFLELNNVKKLFDKFLTDKPNFNEKDIIDKINELEDKMNKIKSNIEDDEISISQKLQEQINEQNDLLDESEKKIDLLEKEIKKQKKEHEQTLKKKTYNLEIEKQELQEKVKSKNEKIKKIEEHLSQLKDEIQNEKKLIQENEEIKIIEQNNYEQLINNITNDLLNGNITNEEILSKYNISNNMFIKCLQDLKINICSNNFINGIPQYKINTTLETNKCINIESKNIFKCIFISDISLNNKDILKTVNLIHDYCINNNINYIFSLGNIFSIDEIINPTLQDLKNIENITKMLIDTYPKTKSINTLLLGGVSEKYCNILGYNPMIEIEKQRLDMFSIGYNHATININNEFNIFNLYTYTNDLYNKEQIRNFISNNKTSKLRFYFNFLSTINNTFIDISSKIVTIPPIYNNELGCNIYHVEAKINEYNNIELINILPIINDEILIPTSHIYYKK